MKKLIPILIVLAGFALFFQVVVIFFIGDHDVSYSLDSNGHQYTIRELYNNKDKVYDFVVKSKKDSFVFSIMNDFNKQDKVIKEIEYYKKDNLKCIFPKYKRSKTFNVSCTIDGNQVSYDYLKQLNNTSIDSIIKNIKKEGYTSNVWSKKSETSVKNGNVEFFNKNLLDDYVVTMWKYNGLYILKSNENIIDKVFLSKDQYENKYGYLIGKYFVYFECDDSCTSIADIKYYNVKDMGKGSVPIHTTLSAFAYINGDYKDNLYITDEKNEKQYTFNPKTEEFTELDSFNIMKDNKLETTSKSEFLKSKVSFNSVVVNNNITKKYGTTNIYKDTNYYYFMDKNGILYRSSIYSPSNGESLFKLDNVTEWKVRDRDILVVSKDTVYLYNDELGLSKIAVNPELIYNHKNIVDFYK